MANKTRKPVPHELTLYAFGTDKDGARCVMDIIDTSRKFAPWWMRRWYRDTDVTHVLAVRPGQNSLRGKMHKVVR